MTRRLWIDIGEPGEGRNLVVTNSPADPLRDVLLWCDPQAGQAPCPCGEMVGCEDSRGGDVTCATGMDPILAGPPENIAYDVILPAEFGNDLCNVCGTLRGAVFRVENKKISQSYPSCFGERLTVGGDDVACLSAAFGGTAPPAHTRDPDGMGLHTILLQNCFKGWCEINGLQLNLSLDLSFCCCLVRTESFPSNGCVIRLTLMIAYASEQIDFIPPVGFFFQQAWRWILLTDVKKDNRFVLFPSSEGPFPLGCQNFSLCSENVFGTAGRDCDSVVPLPPFRGPYPKACVNRDANAVEIIRVTP